MKDIFNVKYSKEITSVDVYDLTGRKVIEMKPNTLEVQLNMTSLSNAMYIVRLQSVDGITELKVYKN
ncbi:T9SS type A sorting domain-containing protein [Flavobacterium terrigena]|uniref:T9SS type A sorting domain-containing protein n=1 Tax=Flavobacterium terrigena TaxID=402734 RepID=UPI0039EE7FA6